MDYKKIYTEDYFTGKDSFFYSFGYGNFQKTYFNCTFKALKPYLKNIKQARVLDVGCAYGFMLQKFPESFEKFGIDISEYALKQAKQILPSATLKIAGAEDALPFADNFFDFVICNDVIEHLENPRQALENISRVLKKDGLLYLNTPNLNWLRQHLFAYADKKEHHISLLTHKRLLELLKNTGFDIVNHYTYSTLTFFFFTKFRSNIGEESAVICKKS